MQNHILQTNKDVCNRKCKKKQTYERTTKTQKRKMTLHFSRNVQKRLQHTKTKKRKMILQNHKNVRNRALQTNKDVS